MIAVRREEIIFTPSLGKGAWARKGNRSQIFSQLSICSRRAEASSRCVLMYHSENMAPSWQWYLYVLLLRSISVSRLASSPSTHVDIESPRHQLRVCLGFASSVENLHTTTKSQNKRLHLHRVELRPHCTTSSSTGRDMLHINLFLSCFSLGLARPFADFYTFSLSTRC